MHLKITFLSSIALCIAAAGPAAALCWGDCPVPVRAQAVISTELRAPLPEGLTPEFFSESKGEGIRAYFRMTEDELDDLLAAMDILPTYLRGRELSFTAFAEVQLSDDLTLKVPMHKGTSFRNISHLHRAGVHYDEVKMLILPGEPEDPKLYVYIASLNEPQPEGASE